MKSAVLVLFVVVWLTFFGLEQSTVRHHFRFVRHFPTLFLLLFSSFFLFFFQGKRCGHFIGKLPAADRVVSLLSRDLDTCPVYTIFFFFLLSVSLLSVQLAL